MTLKELLEIVEEAIEELGEDAKVLLAIQSQYPFEYSIGGSVIFDGKLFLAEGRQIGFLSKEVRSEFEW